MVKEKPQNFHANSHIPLHRIQAALLPPSIHVEVEKCKMFHRDRVRSLMEKLVVCRSESFRYRCESCANVSSWRCICAHTGRVSLPSSISVLPSFLRLGNIGESFVPDGVVGSQTNPLWDGSVLLLRLRKLLLGAERLVGLWQCQSRRHCIL